MLRSAALVFATCSICSAAMAVPAPSPMVQKAKTIIAKRMLDPGSLQIRGAHVVTTQVNGQAQKVLCGEYNAKNKFGGYVGFKGFIYEPVALKGVMTYDGNLQLGFYGESGLPDMDPDPRSAVMAGVDSEVLSAQSHRYYKLAETYVPACLGAS